MLNEIGYFNNEIVNMSDDDVEKNNKLLVDIFDFVKEELPGTIVYEAR